MNNHIVDIFFWPKQSAYFKAIKIEECYKISFTKLIMLNMLKIIK